MMSATCSKPSVRSRCAGAVGENAASGSSPSTGRRPDGARRPAAQRHRAVLGGADQQPADVRVLAQGGEQLGVARLDLLQRQPALLLHQVDEPEVARAEHHRLAIGDVVLRPLRRLAAGRLAERVADHRRLLVAAGELGHLPAGERALDQLVEAVAVSLLEGRSLGLAVVGEDDDLVGAGRVAPGALDPAELLVELAQRLHRVGALEPGVVRDLVVAGEGRVDRRAAAHHVGEHAEDDQVADDHAHRRRAAADRCRRGGRAGARRGGCARIAAVHSSSTSQTNRTSARVTLKPLARKAR